MPGRGNLDYKDIQKNIFKRRITSKPKGSFSLFPVLNIKFLICNDQYNPTSITSVRY